MKNTLLILFVVLTGCVGNYDEIPNQHEALVITWFDTYGMRGNNPPLMEWIRPESFNCHPGPDGEFEGFWASHWYHGEDDTSKCVTGLYWEILNIAEVAHPESFTFSGSSYAHELWHSAMWHRGDLDPGHKDPGFGSDYGHPYGAVDIARDNLRAAGL
jgi:hypothetical protein